VKRVLGRIQIFRAPKWRLVAFSFIHVFIILFLFKSDFFDSLRYSSTGLYFDYASQMFQGAVPYRDFPLEYPPLAILFLALPGLAGSDLSGYAISFTVEILVFDLLGLYLIFAISRLRGLRCGTTLSVYTLSLLALWPVTVTRYDLIPAIMALAAIYCFMRDKTGTSWTILAAGTMTKLFPIIIAPLFLLSSLLHRQYGRAIRGAGVFALTALVIAIPFIVLSPRGLLESFTYQTQRGLQIESLYASLLLVGQALHLIETPLEFDFGSVNIAGHLADTLARVSLLVLLFLLLVVYWYCFNTMRVANQHNSLASDTGAQGELLNFSLLVTLVFIVFNKVLSPQYLVWLYPIVPLVSGKWKPVLWGVFLAAAALTTYLFPYHYLELLDLKVTEIVVLVSRNVLLGAMLLLLMNRFRTGAPRVQSGY
jgi:uncharacterized membrane protein